MKKAVIVSPWLWTNGDQVGMPTIYNTAKGFVNKAFDTHLVIGSSKETRSFDYNGMIIHHFRVSTSRGMFDSFHSIFEYPYGKFEFQGIKRAWRKALISFLEATSLTKDADLVYLISPLCCLLAKKISVKNQIWRFMGVNVLASETTKIPLSSIRSHPIEYLSFKKLSRISKAILPIIIITDDGTKGDKLINSIKVNYRKLLFSKNGVEDFRKNVIEPENTLNSELLHIYNYLLELKSRGLKIVISTNRFANWKRNELTLEVLEKLVIERRREDVIFLFAGDGQQLDIIKERARVTIGNKAIFLGPVGRFTMSLWFKLSDIYISMMDLSQLGNTTFEACLYGLAPVLRNNGETTVFFNKESALLVRDTDEAATAIEHLIDKPDIMISLGMVARDLILKKMGTWDERIDNEILWIEKQFFGDL